MSIHETTHRVTPKEQEIFNIGYAEGKADAVKHGHWIFTDCGWKCNLCDHSMPYWPMASTQERTSYCPSCGARMDGEA